jgi:hypothetical protein
LQSGGFNQLLHHVGKRKRLDAAGGSPSRVAPMDHEGGLWPERLTGKVKALRHTGRTRELDLDSQLDLATALKNQIYLCAIRGPIKEGLPVITRRSDQVFYDETFPTRPRDRMANNIVPAGQIKQGMRNATVTKIKLGRSDQALAHIASPRRQPAHQKQIDEKVDVSPDGRR